MPVSVTMPRLGESVSEGTVTRWLKSEGDRVEADEPLLEVSTDKVDTEIPAPAAGVVKTIKVSEDETVEVGAELAVIDEGGEEGAPDSEPEPESQPAEERTDAQAEQEHEEEQPEPAQPKEEQPAQPKEEQPAQPKEDQPAPRREAPQQAAPQRERPPAAPAPQPTPVQTPQPQASGDGGETASAYVTPLVRKLAAEHQVDLGAITGSGVGGRIRKQDVLDAAKSGGPAKSAQPAAVDAGAPAAQRDTAASEPSERIPTQARQPSAAPTATADQATRAAPRTALRGKTEKLSRLRSVIAQRMTESLQTSAQLTTVVEADVSKIARLRDAAKAEFEAREGVRLSFLPFFALATCEALKEHPNVNASIDTDAGTVTYHDGVHLGVAVDTDRGLLVPVIHDAGDLNLGGLARKIADLAQRTRSNQVGPDELGGGTFTLTNTGSRGALFDTPIINQPQVGILGTGTVVKRPVVVDDPKLGEVIAVRHMMYLALTYDHRLVDGADAARFLLTVKERVEGGDFAAELGR